MWWQPQWHELPGWLGFFAAAVLLLVFISAGDRRRRLNPKQVDDGAGEVGCGKCGYDVRGLISPICPECGSNLNDVGRFTARFRRWQNAPPLLRAALWTAGCCFVFLLVAIGYAGNYGTIRNLHVETYETYFFDNAAGPEQPPLMMRLERQTDRLQPVLSQSRDTIDRSMVAVAVYPSSTKRIDELRALIPGGRTQLDAGTDWPAPTATPAFEIAGTQDDLDAISWDATVGDLLGLGWSNDQRRELAARFAMMTQGGKRGGSRFLTSINLNERLAGNHWGVQPFTVAFHRSMVFTWLPLAIMGGLALLVWIVGLRWALRKRPVVNRRAFVPAFEPAV